ncbi:hypothetical protein E1293_14295 [Actinomadura darangshiensis]|uniref:Uncharacterized protein n=1 Tax=Actinomadura darangshiensis TaxID=705336 RepID=A0A4R5BFE6_9ACTN|nr:hypothetical protein [Actinomadura darangshiensis]TDD83586.1 hypothetical protein E1293_14295 [Actinomadura darangshiensis]
MMAKKVKKFEDMTEGERAEWFYENRAELAENSTPATLERVVSVRISTEDLNSIVDAAKKEGLTPSTFIRMAAIEAATRSAPGPASVMSAEDTQELQADVRRVMEGMAQISTLLERQGIGIITESMMQSMPKLLLSNPHKAERKPKKPSSHTRKRGSRKKPASDRS